MHGQLVSRILGTLCFAAALVTGSASGQSYLVKSQSVGGNPGPAHNYVCPNADGGPALECFLDAVRHLYMMCKHVKSIEIIEFGYEQSGEGTNRAKSESCMDKQKNAISGPYQAALRNAKGSKEATESMKSLHEFWLASLASLRWRAGESPEDYLVRTGMVFPALDEQIDGVRTAMSESSQRVAASGTKGRR